MLTIAQAAERLGVSRDTIRRLLPDLCAVDLMRGKGRRLVRIPEASLDAYVNGARIQAATPTRRMKSQDYDPTLWEAPGRLKRRKRN